MSQPSSGGSFLPKILLTVIAIFLFIIFKNFGVNKFWFEKTGSYWDAFLEQKDAGASEEDIRRERWGGPYIVSKMIQEYFVKNNIKDPVVLVEPSAYLMDQKIISFKLPEPIVFYYYTGIKTVWTNSKNVKDANYVAYLTRQGLLIEPIKSPDQLQQILTKYQKYIPSI